MKRILVIKPLIYGIITLIVYNIIFKTELLFTKKDVTAFINYMQEKNDFLGTTNFVIWFVIIAALIITALNRMDKVK